MRRFIISALMGMTIASGAAAFDMNAMSESERATFRQEIRAYLLENPEVLMEAIAVLEQRQNDNATLAEAQMLVQYEEAIFDDGYSYIGGNPDGDVTIVEFQDYRCGFCKRAFPLVEELISTDGNIRLIVKEFPILGDASVLASRYAIATKMGAGDTAYKSVHDTLMEMKGQMTEAYLTRVSRELGLDHDAILAEMDSDIVSGIIQSNHALGQALEINGTPSFIMGDNFVRGFVELDQMRDIVASVRADQG